MPGRLVRHDGPSTVSVQLLSQPEHNRVCVHILSYIPVRKSAMIDIIEERTAVRNLTLRLNLPKAIARARLVPEDVELAVCDCAVTVPEVNGYSIVELSLKG